MIVEGPNPGAQIALNAIGKQDTYLLENDPENSFFKYDPKRHSNFQKFHRSTKIDNPGTKDTWPFGETIKVTLNPRNMGDLLSNLYIAIDFPGLASNSYYLSDQIGRHLIKSVAMRVDELEVEKFHDDWGIIYDELYLDASEKRTKRYLVNRFFAEGTSDLNNAGLVINESKLFIPIPLFFSRKYEGDEYESNNPNRPYFPTCSIYKQKIEFEITFRPQSFFTNSTDPVSLANFRLITEEITVSNQERIYLTTKPQTLITDIVKKHPTVETELNTNEVKLQLVPDIPVKTLNWFLRHTDFEDENTYSGGANLVNNRFYNRYNFSASDSVSLSNAFFQPIMDSAKIYINGQDLPNLPFVDHAYYKYVVPHNSRLSRPEKNIYTYTFSMNPINVEPSGSLDFGQLQSDRTVLEVKLKNGLSSSNTYSLHLYYVGYQTFKFDGGFMSLAAIPTTTYVPETPVKVINEPVSVTPDGPLGARPRPTGAGVGNLLQM